MIGPLAAPYGVPAEVSLTGALQLDPVPAPMQVPLPGPSRPIRFVPYNGPAVLPDWLRHPADRARVCVTAGTMMAGAGLTGGLDLAGIVRAVADLDVEVVVVLDRAQQRGLGQLPANVRLADAPLALHLLLPSCAALIQQGGAGTTMTALACGVPQLILPQVSDQHFNGERLAATGAGHWCSPADADAGAVRDLVGELLGNGPCRAAAELMRERVQQRPTPAAVAAELADLAGPNRPALPIAPATHRSAQMTQQQAPLPYPFAPAETIYHPSAEYAELRERCPVPHIELPDGTQAYLATRHADVRQVFTDPRFSRAAAAGENRPTRELGSLAEDSLIGMDPPRHTRMRKVVSHAFTFRRVELLRPTVAALIDQMIDEIEAAGRPADLIEHLSAPLPIYVISKLFGIAEADQDKVRQWSDALVGDWDADPDAPVAALAAFGELIEQRRRNPGDDLMSALIAAWDAEDDLSERELISVTAGIFVGGHETTTNQINLFLLVLARHPDQLARLDGHDTEAVARAVEELSRFIQLGDNGVLLPRVTTEPVELGGVQLPAGAAVLPAVVSANRDDSVFAEAASSTWAGPTTRTWATAPARTTASARHWLGWSCKRRSVRCCAGCPGCGWRCLLTSCGSGRAWWCAAWSRYR